MLSRRTMTLALASAAVLPATAFAQADWRAQYPELVLAIVPAENASGVSDRYAPFTEYLAKALGVKVTLRIASDYAAAIEGQRAGNIHIAAHGPASYVRAWTVTKGGVEPFVTTINSDGSIGYYSVAYVRADDKAKTLEDLKGRNLGLVDPNSASGNNVPRFVMNKMGIDPNSFFGKVVYTGSHENAVIALKGGTVDVAFNWWNSEKDSNFSRMVAKGMAKYEDVQLIFKSPLIAGRESPESSAISECSSPLERTSSSQFSVRRKFTTRSSLGLSTRGLATRATMPAAWTRSTAGRRPYNSR